MVALGRPCSGFVRRGWGRRGASWDRWPAPSGLGTADRLRSACATATVATEVPGTRRGGWACGPRPGEGPGELLVARCSLLAVESPAGGGRAAAHPLLFVNRKEALVPLLCHELCEWRFLRSYQC
jgi:hypothetical protein